MFWQHGAACIPNGSVWLPCSPFGEGQRLVFHIGFKIPFCFVNVDADPGHLVNIPKEQCQYVVLLLILGQSQLQALLGAEVDSPGERTPLLVGHKILLTNTLDKVVVNSWKKITIQNLILYDKMIFTQGPLICRFFGGGGGSKHYPMTRGPILQGSDLVSDIGYPLTTVYTPWWYRTFTYTCTFHT